MSTLSFTHNSEEAKLALLKTLENEGFPRGREDFYRPYIVAVTSSVLACCGLVCK